MQTRLIARAALPLFVLACTGAESVLILTKDGAVIEGPASLPAITVETGGNPRKVSLSGLLSVHNGDAPSAHETGRIQAGLAAIQAYTNQVIQSDARKSRDAAVEELTGIGLPVLSPLLGVLKDTDQHEPRPLYRLFERLMPVDSDQLDRTASLLRLANGETLRGKVSPFEIEAGGRKVSWSDIRRLAVRRKSVTRDVELHSLRHSTQIEYLDTGIVLTQASSFSGAAKGWVRLSWDVDGWASDAGGLKVPGPNYKTNLVDGQPFGAVVGRIGASGEVFLLGASFSKKGLPAGRLHVAVNDNRHWQNNIGSFRLTLQASDAYDTGSAR